VVVPHVELPPLVPHIELQVVVVVPHVELPVLVLHIELQVVLVPHVELPRGEPPPKRGAVLSDDAELEKRGFTVGKTLGEGAFGTVKGAFIRESKLLVAIKVIDRSRVAGKVSERALLLERSVHAKLKHSNIIKMLAEFEVNNKVSKTETYKIDY
jgi:hypothetical protein